MPVRPAEILTADWLYFSLMESSGSQATVGYQKREAARWAC
jgi:hypothetical protein